MVEVPATPTSWRVAALAMLGGGALLGFRAAAGGRRRSPRGGIPGRGPPVGHPRVALASRRPSNHPGRASGRGVPPTFTILIAARDESAVLPQVIARSGCPGPPIGRGPPVLRAHRRRRPLDGWNPAGGPPGVGGSGTRGVTRLIRRAGTDLPDGKGAALTAVRRTPATGDLIVVLERRCARQAELPEYAGELTRRAGAEATDRPAPDHRRGSLQPGRRAGGRTDRRLRDPAWPMGVRRMLRIPGQRHRRPQ